MAAVRAAAGSSCRCVRVWCVPGSRHLHSTPASEAHSTPASEAHSTPDTKATHTGQVFEEGDIRNARFEVTPRQTNERWAINLIKEVPPKAVKSRVVACDGSPGALGHPRIYINLDEPGDHSCIYCGLRYYKEDSH